jgi:hypothetical protein
VEDITRYLFYNKIAKPMIEETPDHIEESETSFPPGKEEPLNEFLRTRKLQIRVLQKLLDQIPVDTHGHENEKTNQTKENQNQGS